MTNDDDVPVLVEARDQVMYVTLHRPRVLNAQNSAMRDALVAAYDQFEADEDLRVLVLRGAGRAFSAGADLKEFAGTSLDERAGTQHDAMAHFARLERVRKPVIACIHGYAVGGGLEIALCADLRIATEDALLGTPEARTNGGMPAVAVHRLARMIPHGEAMRIMLTSQPITGRRAYDIGLVQDLAHDADEMMDLAAAYAANIIECHPPSVAAIKSISRWSFLADVAESQRFAEQSRAFDTRGDDRHHTGADFLSRRSDQRRTEPGA
jgi:enoyl-CoA hydratase/carnithine racemase